VIVFVNPYRQRRVACKHHEYRVAWSQCLTLGPTETIQRGGERPANFFGHVRRPQPSLSFGSVQKNTLFSFDLRRFLSKDWFLFYARYNQSCHDYPSPILFILSTAERKGKRGNYTLRLRLVLLVLPQMRSTLRKPKRLAEQSDKNTRDMKIRVGRVRSVAEPKVVCPSCR